jgi:hypothetical protein
MLSVVNTNPWPARLKIAVTPGCTTNRTSATAPAQTHPRSYGRAGRMAWRRVVGAASTISTT